MIVMKDDRLSAVSYSPERSFEHQARMDCGREGLGDRLSSSLLTLRTW